jgi:hypothetical protein
MPPFMATCLLCRRGSLRIIAAITQESLITHILRHLKLASIPPPIAPTRLRQEGPVKRTCDETSFGLLSGTCLSQIPPDLGCGT